MDEQKITSQLQDVFREVFDDSSLTIRPDMTADDIAAWDSFNHVRIIVSVEEKFGVTLPTAEVADLRNIGELAALIRRQMV